MENETKVKKQKTHYDPKNGPRMRAELIAAGLLVPSTRPDDGLTPVFRPAEGPKLSLDLLAQRSLSHRDSQEERRREFDHMREVWTAADQAKADELATPEEKRMWAMQKRQWARHMNAPRKAGNL